MAAPKSRQPAFEELYRQLEEKVALLEQGGLSLDDSLSAYEDAVKLARETNEFVASVVRDDPEHFGGFATMPLPDVDAALDELEYAYDTLGFDGVVLYSSQGDRYLGDPSFDPLFEELERRRAVVFIHPTTLPPGADATGLTIPFGVAEFTFDTTRTVINMLYSGTLERYPSIRYIVSHAGGTIPYLAWRIAGAILSG